MKFRMGHWRCGVFSLALFIGAAGEARASDAPAQLALPEVLRSADAHHPRVVGAMAREEAAMADLGRARGGFDPVLNVRGALRHGGYYELRRFEGELQAPIPVGGIELRAGYRMGLGVDDDQSYPTYYSDETLDRGELSAGARIPLLRGSRMDARRADIGRSRASQSEAVARREWTRLEIRQAASSAYFRWVAAGRAYRISTAILGLAEQRLDAIERRVAAGALPEVEVLEARRAALTRRSAAVSARRSAEAAALVLGLFRRSASGDPAPPALEALPDTLPTPTLPRAPESAFEEVRACHPRVAAHRARVEAQRASLELARADRLPRLDAEFEVSRDFGEGSSTLPGTVFEAGIQFSLPLALREGRGRHDEANAALAAELEALRMAEDALLTDLRDAASAQRAATERYELFSELETTAEALAEAERRRFASGATSLLIVNLREASQAEAAVRRVQSFDELWFAAAEWEALSRCSLGPPDVAGATR